LVTTVLTLTPPANVPLALLDGAVNVTVTPLTGLPPASLTAACNAVAKAVFTAALWGVPPVAVIVAGGPAVFVSEKLAGVATPATLAVTV
jgi:hypothetical protein